MNKIKNLQQQQYQVNRSKNQSFLQSQVEVVQEQSGGDSQAEEGKGNTTAPQNRSKSVAAASSGKRNDGAVLNSSYRITSNMINNEATALKNTDLIITPPQNDEEKKEKNSKAKKGSKFNVNRNELVKSSNTTVKDSAGGNDPQKSTSSILERNLAQQKHVTQTNTTGQQKPMYASLGAIPKSGPQMNKTQDIANDQNDTKESQYHPAGRLTMIHQTQSHQITHYQSLTNELEQETALEDMHMFFVAFYRRRKKIIEESELKIKSKESSKVQKKAADEDLRFDLVGGQENIGEL